MKTGKAIVTLCVGCLTLGLATSSLAGSRGNPGGGKGSGPAPYGIQERMMDRSFGEPLEEQERLEYRKQLEKQEQMEKQERRQAEEGVRDRERLEEHDRLKEQDHLHDRDRLHDEDSIEEDEPFRGHDRIYQR